MQPSWNELDDKQKEELLQTAWSYAKDKGFRRILLLNEKGKTVGFAAEGKSMVSNP
jgi:hypothetical protein